MIDVLGSKHVALDGRHTPALYSRFLSSLLGKYTSQGGAGRHVLAHDDEFKTYSHYTDGRPLVPAPNYSWPDIDVNIQPFENGSDWARFGDCAEDNEADMDLSLSHFVRTVTQNFPGGAQREDPGVRDTWGGWGVNAGQEGQDQWPPSSGGAEWFGQSHY